MSVSNITTVQHPIILPPSREQRINRIDNQINANNREINALESQIIAQKEVSAATKALITNNSETINLTKELINSGNRKIDIFEQLKASSDRLIGVHQEQRGLLQESRDLTKESRDLLVKMIDIGERMLAIMMKNPAKYGGLPIFEIQKQPEVIEAKNQIVEVASNKVETYPLNMRFVLKDTTRKVIDATFNEIKPADTKANRKIFVNLEKRIEAALDKKYETLSFRDVKQILNADYYKPLKIFSKINRLAYSDLSIKDIKA
jgi:hypothetical protein